MNKNNQTEDSITENVTADKPNKKRWQEPELEALYVDGGIAPFQNENDFNHTVSYS